VRPTLVVGLGGTGSWAVTYLKQRLVVEQRWRNIESGSVRPTGSAARYDWPVLVRALDVDRQDRPEVDSVRLETNVEDLFLSAPVGEVVDKIRCDPDGAREAYPTITEWFGPQDAQQIKPDDAMAFMTTGAGQVRAFGRMAFYTDLLAERTVPKRFRLAFDALTADEADSALSIYVISSVAGGTGAGLLIDVLAWLQRERETRGVPFRTTVFCVLPAAFRRTLDGKLLAASEANGYALLRELNRLLVCETPIDFAWRPQETHRMTKPPAQHVYLIDGYRESASQHLDQYRADAVCPVAIADAIYAHVLPTAEGDFNSYLTNIQHYEAGRPDLYSTFGVYIVEYAWDPLVRALAVRAARQIVDEVGATSSVSVDRDVDRLLAGTLVVDDVELLVPPLLHDLMGEAADAGVLVPGVNWLMAPTGSAAIPPLPDLIAPFSDIGTFGSAYASRTVQAQTDARVAAFWGERNAVYSPQKGTQFHSAANYNAVQIEQTWGWAVRALAAQRMSVDAGGPRAGLRLLQELRERLDMYRNRLEREVVRPNVDAARAAVDRSVSFLNPDPRWRRGAAQRAYLTAAQRLLATQVQEECRQRAVRTMERLLAAVDSAAAEIDVWRRALDTAAGSLATLADEVSRARQSAQRLPLRRILPRVTDAAAEDRLYQQCVGPSGTAGLPARLATVGAGLAWRPVNTPAGPRLALPALSTSPPESDRAAAAALVDLLIGRAYPLFDPLRTLSVFEILEAVGERGIAVGQEMMAGGAWLASYDTGEHHRASNASRDGIDVQEMRYVLAEWPSVGAGGATVAADLRAFLAQQGVSLEDVALSRQAGLRPTADKIVYFAARHSLLLQAFPGVTSLRPAYQRRRAGPLSPHVLPEEKGAALLEYRADELFDEGVVDKPLRPLSGEHLTLCRDIEFLRAVAVGLANETLRVRRGPTGEVSSWWVVSDHADDECVSDSHLLDGAIRELVTSTSRRHQRRRIAIMRAALEASRYPEWEERTHRYFTLMRPPYVDEYLWTLLTVAARLPGSP
jgi:hypothetical protein